MRGWEERKVGVPVANGRLKAETPPELLRAALKTSPPITSLCLLLLLEHMLNRAFHAALLL